ncbi:MAG: LysR family transcriptional regulator [Deltaproteobacteria bacterium]|nr:LysR family transcriptional regulator [Deltaproteobacteria bacterium]
MEIYQLKTFVAVARDGSITRASERLYLSQPAVSAHIKALEETLGLTLFERTPKGMSLTSALLDEATRMKGRLTGKLRLGAGANSNTELIGRLLTVLSDRCPEVEVTLQHCTSVEILHGLRTGTLDAGFYNETGEPDPALTTIEVARFVIYLAAPPGTASAQPVNWKAIEALPWIGTTAGSCCGQAAEHLFQKHQFRPRRMISVDRESVTRTLIAGGVGVGLLHADTAQEAVLRGEVAILCEAEASARVLFAHLAGRAQDPVLGVVSSIVREQG